MEQTSRKLEMRLKEHLYKKEKSFTSIHTQLGCTSIVTAHKFTVLRKVDSNFDRSLLEAFYIDKLKPSLNKKIEGGNLNLVLSA